METSILLYLVVMNLAGLLAMGIDKRRAVKRQYRIPEKTLFGISIAGGSIGAWAGMYLFHHKTKHLQFVIGIPVILFLQVILAAILFIGVFR